ncbi:predicted protein [Chaetomium globosum CBS 148.51]|uniref:Uncharacterized protein n=1 Tax=Chaetomium globosum (strain ATCC 6205 / CBS 148.51 / DSM 1962 / NBRC 6347 / NRRL 1970) TaxID=306901 RepID=Q2GXF5_CHAGB|nr:uncharacterized protein CHGG_07349 [Chaetomium globosum CBS 148.51]EAQ86096.1 predicted protein [Chaetomium globosum CBS 148.51]
MARGDTPTTTITTHDRPGQPPLAHPVDLEAAANAGHICGVGALPRLPITRARGRICRAFSGTRWACLTGRRGGKRAMGHTSPIGTFGCAFPHGSTRCQKPTRERGA